MDPLLPSRAQAQQLSPTLPQKTFGYHIWQGRMSQERPSPGWPPKYVCPAHQVALALAWPGQMNAGRLNPHWLQTYWKTYPTLQRHLQARQGQVTLTHKAADCSSCEGGCLDQ